MKLLLDTHLLLRGAAQPSQLSATARKLISDTDNQLLFSAVSIWEVAIKNALGRSDFHVEPTVLRRNLIENGYVELPISSLHAAGVSALPNIHSDPFDRLLLSQAIAEGITLVTSDAVLAKYPGPVRKV